MSKVRGILMIGAVCATLGACAQVDPEHRAPDRVANIQGEYQKFGECVYQGFAKDVVANSLKLTWLPTSKRVRLDYLYNTFVGTQILTTITAQQTEPDLMHVEYRDLTGSGVNWHFIEECAAK